MTKKYRYRPPLKYLLVGLGGLLLAIIFGMAIGKDKIWFSIIVGIFCLMTLAMGIGFLTIYFRKLNAGPLILGEDYLEIPCRWKARTRLKFSEILSIGDFDTFDQVIEVESAKGVHMIERKWMKGEDFEQVRKELWEVWTDD